MKAVQNMLNSICERDALKHLLELDDRQVSFLQDLQVVDCTFSKEYAFQEYRKEAMIEFHSNILGRTFAFSATREGDVREIFFGHYDGEHLSMDLVLEILNTEMGLSIRVERDSSLTNRFSRFNAFKSVFKEMLDKVLEENVSLEREKITESEHE